MVTIGYGYKEFPDVYIVFKRTEEVTEYLQNNIQFTNRFRARDFIDFQTSESELNGVSHNDRNNLTIETPAMLDFSNYDIVYDIKYGIEWRITNAQTVDDGQMKENSMRPRKLTRLTLIR